ncbi:hypothetical protein Y032_0036g3185 [Ancylostoma ceylanicum]|uniref:Uncharacterized protein n=1 Tax=Ancylostoma ceylanicum TaxID=53326 RepID=A0A016ULX9_9BILA|nr:hypothetical protein Y032_0036g3185 [Ancylostoma ceylanicum]
MHIEVDCTIDKRSKCRGYIWKEERPIGKIGDARLRGLVSPVGAPPEPDHPSAHHPHFVILLFSFLYCHSVFPPINYK